MKESEKKYQETLEALYFSVRENNNWRKQEDLKYLILCEFSEVIGTLYTSLDRLQGERKKNAENTFKTLVMCYDSYGKFYLDELKARKDLAKANESLIEASKTIDELRKEIEILRSVDNL